MRLYFLRHGLAEDRGTKPDSERALTAEGVRELRKSLQALYNFKVKPATIYTSPLVRAYQTAEIAAELLGGRIQVEGSLAPGFDERRLHQLLRQAPQGDVMVVGHEPDFSQVISMIIGGGRIEMKKGGVARVDLFDPPNPPGELVWLLAPRVMG